MLTTNKKITLEGKSVIDGKEVFGFRANIDSQNPKNMSMTEWKIDKELYKANRETCRADQLAFEDLAYAKQDEMIAALGEMEE